jgi:hypothetical protein
MAAEDAVVLAKCLRDQPDALPGHLDRAVLRPGRRSLPIMAARWVFNGGTALALGLVG